MREGVRAVLEYPRVTCDDHYSWFNGVDRFVDGIHFQSRKFLLIGATLDPTVKHWIL